MLSVFPAVRPSARCATAAGPAVRVGAAPTRLTGSAPLPAAVPRCTPPSHRACFHCRLAALLAPRPRLVSPVARARCLRAGGPLGRRDPAGTPRRRRPLPAAQGPQRWPCRAPERPRRCGRSSLYWQHLQRSKALLPPPALAPRPPVVPAPPCPLGPRGDPGPPAPPHFPAFLAGTSKSSATSSMAWRMFLPKRFESCGSAHAPISWGGRTQRGGGPALPPPSCCALPCAQGWTSQPRGPPPKPLSPTCVSCDPQKLRGPPQTLVPPVPLGTPPAGPAWAAL